MKQAQASHVFPDHSDSRRQFNSCVSRLFYCSTYSVSACDISCSELCRRCVFILTMSGTQCPSSSHYRFLVSSSDAQVNKKTLVGQNKSYLGVHVFESVCAHHGRHDPADVDGVVSVQVVHSSVLLVPRADLEQIQAGLQNTGLILYRRRERNGNIKLTVDEAFIRLTRFQVTKMGCLRSGLGSGLDKGCLHLTTQLLFAVLPLQKTSIDKPLIIPPISLYFV